LRSPPEPDQSFSPYRYVKFTNTGIGGNATVTGKLWIVIIGADMGTAGINDKTILIRDNGGLGDVVDSMSVLWNTAVGGVYFAMVRRMLVPPNSQILLLGSGTVSCIECDTLDAALAIL